MNRQQPRQQEADNTQHSGGGFDDDWKRQEARNLMVHLPRDRTHALEIIAYMTAEVLARF